MTLFGVGLLVLLIGMAASSLCLAIGGYLADYKQAWRWNFTIMGVGAMLMIVGH
uniref:Major facilitator superfamily (MFS) profile domain-containing protein n=1 Tax=Pseudomonas phage RVTF4 TaxID=3236931 RepID=A0AB39CCK6_9VIRU